MKKYRSRCWYTFSRVFSSKVPFGGWEIRHSPFSVTMLKSSLTVAPGSALLHAPRLSRVATFGASSTTFLAPVTRNTLLSVPSKMVVPVSGRQSFAACVVR